MEVLYYLNNFSDLVDKQQFFVINDTIEYVCRIYLCSLLCISMFDINLSRNYWANALDVRGILTRVSLAG